MKDKEQKFYEINEKLNSLLSGEPKLLPNLANASALLFNELEGVNWAGFYLLENDELILGPFQGLPACIRIKIGNGVCGTAVKERKTLVVEDVHEFPGHIACDQASRSEIVVPLLYEGRIIGVLDIDSPVKARFNEVDRKYLEEFVDILLENSNFNRGVF